MWSLIHVSTRADRTIPSTWDEGPVMTRISLNLQKIRSSLDEIAVTHSGRKYWRDLVVSSTALDGIGAMVGSTSVDKSKLGNSPKVHQLVQRHTNLILGCPSTVLRWSWVVGSESQVVWSEYIESGSQPEPRDWLKSKRADQHFQWELQPITEIKRRRVTSIRNPITVNYVDRPAKCVAHAWLMHGSCTAHACHLATLCNNDVETALRGRVGDQSRLTVLVSLDLEVYSPHF